MATEVSAVSVASAVTGVDAGGPAGTSKDSREHKARVPARREREVSARADILSFSFWIDDGQQWMLLWRSSLAHPPALFER